MSPSSDINPTPTSTELPALTVNLGALTTAFTPPSDCTSLTLAVFANRAVELPVTTIFQLVRGYECPQDRATPRLQLVSSCYPGRWGPAFNNVKDWQGPNAVYPLFSPGLMCPSGYETACTMVYSQPGATSSRGPSGLSTWSVLAKGETGYGCCPSGYRCYTPYMCISTAPLSATITADMSQGCPVSSTWNRTTTTQFVNSTVLPIISAPQLVLIQRGTANTTETEASSPPATSAVSPDDTTHAGLSTALKAAIGAAVPLILIILALASYIIYRRRSRKNPTEALASEQEGGGGGGGSGSGSRLPGLDKPELDATPSPFGRPLGPGSELDGTPRPGPGADPTPAAGQVSELPGSGSARVVAAMCELPGDEEFASPSPPQPKEMRRVAAANIDDDNPLAASMGAASEPTPHHTKDKDAERSGLGGQDG